MGAEYPSAGTFSDGNRLDATALNSLAAAPRVWSQFVLRALGLYGFICVGNGKRPNEFVLSKSRDKLWVRNLRLVGEDGTLFINDSELTVDLPPGPWRLLLCLHLDEADDNCPRVACRVESLPRSGTAGVGGEAVAELGGDGTLLLLPPVTRLGAVAELTDEVNNLASALEEFAGVLVQKEEELEVVAERIVGAVERVAAVAETTDSLHLLLQGLADLERVLRDAVLETGARRDGTSIPPTIHGSLVGRWLWNRHPDGAQEWRSALAIPEVPSVGDAVFRVVELLRRWVALLARDGSLVRFLSVKAGSLEPSETKPLGSKKHIRVYDLPTAGQVRVLFGDTEYIEIEFDDQAVDISDDAQPLGNGLLQIERLVDAPGMLCVKTSLNSDLRVLFTRR